MQGDGFNNSELTIPRSGQVMVKRFHHVEFWCSDATTTARHFSYALGIPIVAKSDLSTGNTTHVSYLLRSGELSLLFTARPLTSNWEDSPTRTFFSFFHLSDYRRIQGLAIRAVAVEVDDVETAFETSIRHRAISSRSPLYLDNGVEIGDVYLLNDVVLRYICCKNSCDPNPRLFIPGFEPVEATSDPPIDLGITGLDHVVALVSGWSRKMDYLKRMAGFHLGMYESHSAVLCNDDETVVFKLNDLGREGREAEMSVYESYLKFYGKDGLQCLALTSKSLFTTVRELKKRTLLGGFQFTAAPAASYYETVKKDFAHVLTNEQIEECEELGILVQRDDKNGGGTVLQAVTRPIDDR